MFHAIASVSKDSHLKVPDCICHESDYHRSDTQTRYKHLMNLHNLLPRNVLPHWPFFTALLSWHAAHSWRNPLFLDVTVYGSGWPTFVFVYDLSTWHHVYVYKPWQNLNETILQWTSGKLQFVPPSISFPEKKWIPRRWYDNIYSESRSKLDLSLKMFLTIFFLFNLKQR